MIIIVGNFTLYGLLIRGCFTYRGKIRYIFAYFINKLQITAIDLMNNTVIMVHKDYNN